MAMVTFECSIPPSESAIKIGGGAGDSVKIQLECLVGNNVTELAALRGQNLRCIIGDISSMSRLSEFIDHGE